MGGPRQSGDLTSAFDAAAGSAAPNYVAASATGAAAAPGLHEPELDAALQLLVERAQYITGATGTALALPQGNEMVCRASAGSCAPAIGARLQVRSGLTGESIARRQLLRCDNAETDPRVNLEACRALGIASMVVLPLLRQNGEVRGLFELFSDHAYAFEERDLLALERMADLTITALDLAEQRHGTVPPAPPGTQPETRQPETRQTGKRDESGTAAAARGWPRAAEAVPPSAAQISVAIPSSAPNRVPTRESSVGEAETVPAPTDEFRIPTQNAAPAGAAPQSAAAPAPATEPLATSAPVVAIPDAIRRVQKCEGCGFPVSEGRTLCVDCERKREKLRDQAQDAAPPAQPAAEPAAAAPDAPLPPFLAKAGPVRESWLANHVNLLAIVVLILAVLVAIVVFR